MTKEEMNQLYSDTLVTLRGGMISYPTLFTPEAHPDYPQNPPKFSASFFFDRTAPEWAENQAAAEKGIVAAYQLATIPSNKRQFKYTKLKTYNLASVHAIGVRTSWFDIEHNRNKKYHPDPNAEMELPEPEGIHEFAMLSASTGKKFPPKVLTTFKTAIGADSLPVLGGHMAAAVQVRFQAATSDYITAYLQLVVVQARLGDTGIEYVPSERFGILGGGGLQGDEKALEAAGIFETLPESFDIDGTAFDF